MKNISYKVALLLLVLATIVAINSGYNSRKHQESIHEFYVEKDINNIWENVVGLNDQVTYRELNEVTAHESFQKEVILLTDISNSSLSIVHHMAFDRENGALAEELELGDYCGYIHLYIAEALADDLTIDTLETHVKALDEVCSPFVTLRHAKDVEYEEHLQLLMDELEKTVGKYPENVMIRRYTDRTVTGNDI